MIHLREISLQPSFKQKLGYPYEVPALVGLSTQRFSSPVTIFVGENGSGKSTLLEGIAQAVGSITIGSEEIADDRSLYPVRPLAEALKLVWNKRTKRGFFLRAEDYFGYVKRFRHMGHSIQADLKEINQDFQERSDYARNLALGPSISSLTAMEKRYGEDLDAHSHGESYLTLFKSRLVPEGLYLLDEPEAALSPLSQLGLISLIRQAVSEDSQFIIATHSPILMAMPDALIYNFDYSPPRIEKFDDLENIALYRAFLSDPDAFLRHL